MTVDTAGVTATPQVIASPNFITGFGVDIKFSGGRIFTTTGRVIDPDLPGVIGTVALGTTFGNLVTTDAALNRVFYTTLDVATGNYRLLAFDTSTMPPVPVGRQDLATNIGPFSLIRWGAKGLAFTNGSQVILVESTALIP
jgi:hypothetical protein